MAETDDALKSSPYAKPQKFVSKSSKDGAQLISMLGRQPLSNKTSAATPVFGTSTRDQTLHLYLSKEHSKQGYGKNSPGPVYTVKSGLGKQHESFNLTAPEVKFGSVDRQVLGTSAMHQFSHDPCLKVSGNYPGPGTYDASSSVGKQTYSVHPTSANFSFGTGTRDQLAKVFTSKEHEDAFIGKSSPGPGTYDNHSSVGKQAVAKQRSSATPKFGTANRFRYEYERRAAALPGAGAYKNTNAVGPQALSANETMPKYGFGTSTRATVKKVFISKEHEKSSGGHEGPGPAFYQHKSSVGKQVTSVKKTNSSWTLGKETRFKINLNGGSNVNDVPGPGTYNR